MGTGPGGRFVKGFDPHRGDPYEAAKTAGRPPKPWTDAMKEREPRALEVLDLALEGKVKNGYQYSAAKDILSWTDPERNKQKQAVTVDGEVRHKVLVAYVNDWRKNADDHPALPARGAEGDSVGGVTIQRTSVRPTVGEDADGGGSAS